MWYRTSHTRKFLSRALAREKYCYMLGFLGNMTSVSCCVTVGLLRFRSNATVPVAKQWVCCISLVTQQLKQRRYYGYGVVI
jgi:hypothetical protein